MRSFARPGILFLEDQLPGQVVPKTMQKSSGGGVFSGGRVPSWLRGFVAPVPYALK